MIRAGVSSVDITPQVGMAMSGYAARTETACAAHDPLTVRALVVGDTALVVADVIGIDADMSRRVRTRCSLPGAAVTIAAVHNHGGPVSMKNRLGPQANPDYLMRLEGALIQAIDLAAERRVPVRMFGGTAVDPGFARNRRHLDGPVDRQMPVLRIERQDGAVLAFLVSYACHPVVLGADNLRWTADYVHFLRAALHRAVPGATAIFATGCAGDVNSGHSAASSLLAEASPARSFATAERMGNALAEAVLCLSMEPLGEDCGSAEVETELEFSRREEDDSAILAQTWFAHAAESEGIDALLYRIWAAWASAMPTGPLAPLPERVTTMNWGGAGIIGLPGEIFASTALDLRSRLNGSSPLFVLAYADDNPGYIPPESEFIHGGYEIDEAHRFYGLPATFAPGSAERLVEAALAATTRTRICLQSDHQIHST